MTKQEFLDNIRYDMKRLKEQELKYIEDLKTKGLTEEETKERKKEIIETFFSNMEWFKKIDWYEEAIESMRHERSLKRKLVESAYKVMKLKKEIKKPQSEEKLIELKNEIEEEEKKVKDLTVLYKQAKLELWDDKPGTFIDFEINKAGSLLERRKINIKGVNIEYIISTTKKWKWVVDDCKVVDSFKIKDPKVISEFIDKVIFSYPDLINSRKSMHKEREKREKEIKNSFKLEWLAHNFAYLVLMFWNTEKEMVDPKKKGFLYDKLRFLRESARDVDLDDEQIRKQILFNMAWLIYKYLPEKSNKQKK